jgi:hypothetical protein
VRQLVEHGGLERAVAVFAVHPGPLEKIVRREPRVELGFGQEMVVACVDLVGARRPGRGGDDALEARHLGHEAVAERAFADAGGAGQDQEHGLGRGHAQ